MKDIEVAMRFKCASFIEIESNSGVVYHIPVDSLSGVDRETVSALEPDRLYKAGDVRDDEDFHILSMLDRNTPAAMPAGDAVRLRKNWHGARRADGSWIAFATEAEAAATLKGVTRDYRRGAIVSIFSRIGERLHLNAA